MSKKEQIIDKLNKLIVVLFQNQKEQTRGEMQRNIRGASNEKKVAGLEGRFQDQQLSVEMTSYIPDGNTYDLIKEQYNKWKTSPIASIQ